MRHTSSARDELAALPKTLAALSLAAEAEGAGEDKASMLRAATWRYERNVMALQTEFFARQEALRRAYLEEVTAIQVNRRGD